MKQLLGGGALIDASTFGVGLVVVPSPEQGKFFNTLLIFLLLKFEYQFLRMTIIN